MIARGAWSFIACLVGFAAACTSAPSADDAVGSAGATATSTSSGGQSNAASGGMASATAGASSVASVAGAAPMVGTGGRVSQSMGGMPAATAGAPTVVGGASVVSQGGSAGAAPVNVPSAGCGLANPASGDRQIDVGGMMGQYIVSVPPNYDPDTAYPLGFAFHGFGRTAADCQATDCPGVQDVWGDGAVIVYMRSLGEGWEQAEVREQNLNFFSSVLALMKQEYCIDASRVFVAGTSSGAHFTNILGCRFGDQLLAVSPVAGAILEQDGCTGPVSALVIHGIDDYHVAFTDGEAARDYYVALDGCSTTAVPDLGTAHAAVRAARDQQQGTDECVDYPDCAGGKAVRWCEHSESGYDDSTHGWPVVGGQLIWDFVRGL